MEMSPRGRTEDRGSRRRECGNRGRGNRDSRALRRCGSTDLADAAARAVRTLLDRNHMRATARYALLPYDPLGAAAIRIASRTVGVHGQEGGSSAP